MLRWPGGSLRREYVLLFDPPGTAFTATQSAVADTAPAVAITSVPPAQQSPPPVVEAAEPARLVALVARVAKVALRGALGLGAPVVMALALFVLLQFARHDFYIAEMSGRELHRAAGEPKELAAYDADGHVTGVIGTGPYEVTALELPASISTTGRAASTDPGWPATADGTSFMASPRSAGIRATRCARPRRPRRT